MGSDVTGSRLRAIGKPLGIGITSIVGATIDGRGPTYTPSYTQASPEAGEAIPSQDSTLRLRTSGSQSDGGVLIVKTQDANPQPGAFIWRDAEQTDSTVDWRGQDIGQPTSYDNLWFADGSTIYSIKAPHIIPLPDGQMVAVAQVRTSATATQATIQAKTYDPSTSTWSSATTLYTRTLGSEVASPCLSYDPLTGHVYVAHWLLDTTSNLAGVRIHRGAYSGSTWTWSTHSRQAVDTQIDISSNIGTGNPGYDLGRLRMAFGSSGQVLLVGAVVQHQNAVTGSYINGLVQYGSIDGAASFQQVFIDIFNLDVLGSDLPLAIDHDVLYDDGHFVLAGFARVSTQNDQLVYLPLPHAYANIKTRFEAFAATDFEALGTSGIIFDSTVSANGGQHALNQSAVWVDEGGTIYALTVAAASAYASNTICWVSVDGGSTWKITGDGDRQGSVTTKLLYGTIIKAGDVSTYLYRPAACAHRGRQVIIAQCRETDGTTDERLSVITLGGSTTVNLPAQVDSPAIYQRQNMTRALLPLELFQNLTGITNGNSGTNTPLIAGAGVQITTTSGTYYWTSTIGCDDETGVVVLLDYTPTSGGTTSTNGRSLEIEISDGSTSSYKVTVRMSTTQFLVYDNEAAATVATSAAKIAATPTQILIAVANGKVSCWERDADTNYDRHWTEVCNGSALTAETASPAAASSIEWGHRSTATVVTVWGMLALAEDTAYTKGFAAGFTTPDDLIGRPFPRRARTIGVDDGVRLSTLDGNPHEGDIYNVRAESSFSIKHIAHSYSPTPRAVWRSQADGVQQLIPIVINTDEDPAATVQGRLQSDLIYVLLRNINFSDFAIDYYDGSWNTLATVDSSLKVDNAREFNGIITIDTTGTNTETDTVHLFADEYAGCDCRHKAATFFRIASHSAGILDNAADHLLPRFRVLTPGSDAGTRLSTVGTLRIIPRDVLVVVNTAGVKFRALRLNITSQSTFDGFYRMGALEIGDVLPFGAEYGRGRIIEGVPGTVVDDASDGTRRRTDRAPGYRSVRIAWTFPLEQSDLFGATPDPDYLTASDQTGNGPVAAANDVPWSLQYLVLHHGAGRPVVYIPSILPSTGAGSEVIVYNRRHDFLHAYVDSSVQIESVLGEEGQGRDSAGATKGETVRTATVTFREVV
jgi:hypothetical protein